MKDRCFHDGINSSLFRSVFRLQNVLTHDGRAEIFDVIARSAEQQRRLMICGCNFRNASNLMSVLWDTESMALRGSSLVVRLKPATTLLSNVSIFSLEYLLQVSQADGN